MEAWVVGVKIEDPHVLKMIEAGHLAGFSIGGTGKRVGVEKSMSDEQIDSVAEAIVKAFDDARASPPRGREKLPAYLRRIAKGRALSEHERAAIAGVFSFTKRNESMARRNDYLVKKQATEAENQLNEIAKGISTEHGITFEKAFVRACQAHPDLYRTADFRKSVLRGPGFDDDGASPDNHADGAGDYEGEGGEDGDALEEAAEFYRPNDVSANAASGSRAYDADGGARSAVDHFSEGRADDDVLLIQRTADKFQQDSATSASRNMRGPMPRAAAVAKSMQAHPDAYLRLKRAGKLDQCQ
jgi:hypothetical protein